MSKHKGLLKESRIEDVYELGLPMGGLISEEEVPYSLSLSDSICSSSTIDLEAVDQSKTHATCDCAQQFHASPLENNFIEDKQFKTAGIDQMSVKERTLDMSNSLHNTSRNCISLHDVSNLAPLQLPENSTNTVSCETIHSQSLSSTTKSKDSGFQRSISCLSLNSGRRNYDHVESKVKAYIRNIKESEALRKQKLLAEKAEVVNEQISREEFDPLLDKKDLALKVQELEEELHEKALFIDTQQRNYNMLLLKLAEAKNTINALRVQRISLNYNLTTESQNTRIGDIDFGVFDQEISRPEIKLFNTISSCGSNPSEKKPFVLFNESSNDLFTDGFKPKSNSTPQNKRSNKCLSPISKIFSSSSRLDKGFRPLASLKKEKSTSVSLFHNISRSNSALFQRPGEKVLNFSKGNLKNKSNQISNAQPKNTLSYNRKHVSANIDLPNVDPFDKVKKWQASLPSINLLGTQSSSDCEDPLLASKTNSNLRGHTENEINGSLSLELMSKLKISEEPMNSSSCKNTAMYKKKKMSVNLNSISVTQTNTNLEFMNDQTSGNEFERVLCETKNKNTFSPNANLQTCTESLIPSTSESESQTYLPKSSSWTCTSERQFKSNSSYSTDDSSSVSSSSSRGSPTAISSNKSNLKFTLRKSKTEVKIQKPFKSSFVTTKIVLQKPTLNYEPMTNIRNIHTDKALPKRTQSLSNCTSNLMNLNVESSQRKAWNERNTTNFNVCKEFYLKRSSSLQECLNIMQNLVGEGSSIIESLERSHCH